MTRYNDILNGLKDSLESEAAQKTYKGKKRSELKDSDFLFPETRSFPIVTPQDIPDAISNFGRMKSNMTYEAFLKKLYNMAKRKGPEFVAALPKKSKEQLDIKANYENRVTFPEIEYEDDRLSLISEDDEDKEGDEEDIEMESSEDEMDEYKQDFFQMSLSSIKSIMVHAKAIVDAVERGQIKEGLTESWLQGKIAVTEDYLLTIYNFLMFGETEADTEGAEAAKNLPGLWENIRKKKERMGKKYKPAKPGDKDRPDPSQWKKLTK